MLSEFPHLGALESLLVGLISGTSVLAVVGYYLTLKEGYPKEGFGRSLLQSVYRIIRICHVALFTLALVVFIIFGVLDGSLEILHTYGFKLAVLFINAVVAAGITFRFLNVHYASPILVAGWVFLALYHYHSVFIGQALQIFLPALLYLSLIAVVMSGFALLRNRYTE